MEQELEEGRNKMVNIECIKDERQGRKFRKFRSIHV